MTEQREEGLGAVETVDAHEYPYAMKCDGACGGDYRFKSHMWEDEPCPQPKCSGRLRRV